MRAVSVNVGRATRYAGLVDPGDRVDVVFTAGAPPTGDLVGDTLPTTTGGDRLTRVLFEDVRVLAIDRTVRPPAVGGEEPPEERSEFATATLEVSPAQAPALIHANREGELALVARAAMPAAVPPSAPRGGPYPGAASARRPADRSPQDRSESGADLPHRLRGPCGVSRLRPAPGDPGPGDPGGPAPCFVFPCRAVSASGAAAVTSLRRMILPVLVLSLACAAPGVASPATVDDLVAALRAGDDARARELLDTLEAKGLGGAYDVRFLRGVLHLRAGEGAQAARVFAELEALEGPAPRLASGQALSAWAAGRPAEALARLEQATRLWPEDPGVWANLGDVHRALAARAYQRVRALRGDVGAGAGEPYPTLPLYPRPPAPERSPLRLPPPCPPRPVAPGRGGSGGPGASIHRIRRVFPRGALARDPAFRGRGVVAEAWRARPVLLVPSPRLPLSRVPGAVRRPRGGDADDGRPEAPGAARHGAGRLRPASRRGLPRGLPEAGERGPPASRIAGHGHRTRGAGGPGSRSGCTDRCPTSRRSRRTGPAPSRIRPWSPSPARLLHRSRDLEGGPGSVSGCGRTPPSVAARPEAAGRHDIEWALNSDDE